MRHQAADEIILPVTVGRSTSPTSRRISEEKNSLGRLSVPVKILSSAVQEHDVVICSSRIRSQRNDFRCQNNSTLTVDLNDKTKPVQKPDAKIRRMTESNERPLQSASTRARLSERIRRRAGGYRPSAHLTAYKMDRALRTTRFS